MMKSVDILMLKMVSAIAANSGSVLKSKIPVKARLLLLPESKAFFKN